MSAGTRLAWSISTRRSSADSHSTLAGRRSRAAGSGPHRSRGRPSGPAARRGWRRGGTARRCRWRGRRPGGGPSAPRGPRRRPARSAASMIRSIVSPSAAAGGGRCAGLGARPTSWRCPGSPSRDLRCAHRPHRTGPRRRGPSPQPGARRYLRPQPQANRSNPHPQRGIRRRAQAWATGWPSGGPMGRGLRPEALDIGGVRLGPRGRCRCLRRRSAPPPTDPGTRASRPRPVPPCPGPRAARAASARVPAPAGSSSKRSRSGPHMKVRRWGCV